MKYEIRAELLELIIEKQAKLINYQRILINFNSIWGKYADLLQSDKLSAKFIHRQYVKINEASKELAALESQSEDSEEIPKRTAEELYQKGIDPRFENHLTEGGVEKVFNEKAKDPKYVALRYNSFVAFAENEDGITIFDFVCKVMEEYARQFRGQKEVSDERSILIQFLSEYLYIKLPEGKDCIDVVDEYLKSK